MTRRFTAVVCLAFVSSLVVVMPVQGSRAKPASSAKPASISTSSTLEDAVLDRLNAIRAARGLPKLRLHPKLTTVARRHSMTMIHQGFFAHESPNGAPFWKRIRSFYGPGRHQEWAVGENLLYASPSISANAAVRYWMGSPGHRKNILNPTWREVGVAVVYTEAARGGVYGRGPVTVMTTDFGVRR